MAGSTLTIKLTDTTNVTMTLTTASWPDARQAAQDLGNKKGFFDDAGVWHPSSAIVSVTIS